MKKLAIVGLARGWERAPIANEKWDVWRCNPGFWAERIYEYGERKDAEKMLAMRPTAWFEIHTRRYLKAAHGQSYLRGVETLTRVLEAPTYLLDPKGWNVQEPYLFPRWRIAKAFPRGDYHAGSFDWLLAFALLEGYQHVELYGVDLGPTDAGEPISARPCLEYWCGVAAGRGVEVVSHSPSLFKIFNYQRATTPYHYDDTWRLIEDRRKQ
jgi:hypothetical protein